MLKITPLGVFLCILFALCASLILQQTPLSTFFAGLKVQEFAGFGDPIPLPDTFTHKSGWSIKYNAKLMEIKKPFPYQTTFSSTKGTSDLLRCDSYLSVLTLPDNRDKQPLAAYFQNTDAYPQNKHYLDVRQNRKETSIYNSYRRESIFHRYSKLEILTTPV